MPRGVPGAAPGAAPDDGSDDTVLLRPPPRPAPLMPPRQRRRGLALAALAGAIGLGLGWWAVPGPPPAAPPSTAAAPVAAVPAIGREALLAWQPAETALLRLADRPAIYVIAFPDLRSQGRTMNRIAALIEKARTPRDRVLDDAALSAAIAGEGLEADTYYFGHDYSLADVERFFALARDGGVALNAEERWLEARLPGLVAEARGAPRAIITVPAEGGGFDASARRAVLEHEAGHGLFFTDPDFAAQVTKAWREVFTEAEREAFRRFLKGEGYDTALEWLMANEAMAYLVFTPDPRFFDPWRDVAMTPASAERLRAAMRPR